jgi:hypothetical protein
VSSRFELCRNESEESCPCDCVRRIDVPPGETGGFDHGDVDEKSGLAFVAHTAFDCVEVIDGPGGRHVLTVAGCPEASGVAAAPTVGLMFAAARGAGRVLVLEAASGNRVGELSAGFRPNGCAWNPTTKQLLVADVQDNQARLVDVETGSLNATTHLPGRPRWAAHDDGQRRFLINISDPACVAVIDESGELVTTWPVDAAGPHGMALDQSTKAAFIACDNAELITLNLVSGAEISRLTIAGPPDVLWYNPSKSALTFRDSFFMRFCRRAAASPSTTKAIDDPALI